MFLVSALHLRSRTLLPGVCTTLLVAGSAAYLAAHFRAPPMLLALLFGIWMNFLTTPSSKPGIEFAARDLLRVGVALLGTRITFEQIAQLGWHPIVLVIVSVVATILFSAIAARMVGFNTLFGFLTGGATAICGASAALALSASLPAHPNKEIATAFTIIGASVVSMLAMIAYPILAHHLDLSAVTSGVFIGGSIHEVAHVVGAGYSISRETGDIATIVKLMRVAMLVPVIAFAAMITRRAESRVAAAERPPLLPWFAVGFVLLAGINSLGWIASTVQTFTNDVSRWCLIVAMSAIGMKTELRQIVAVGLKPVVLMLGEAVFLAVLVLCLSRWLS
ncbi:MAG TPA: putative sulfate exporter family transporter [Steroidobacteraceae bacterium]|nr:putative sulfate exporter family transporter [Steroidobacteraceae bacterium]